MKSGAVILLLAAVAGEGQQPKSQVQSTNEVRLRATVEAVVPLADFSGEVTPVHGDPRFALTLRIETADPPAGKVTAGAVVRFAIHSPSKLFRGEPTKSKPYDFLLYRKIHGGKTRFVGLTVHPIEDKSSNVGPPDNGEGPKADCARIEHLTESPSWQDYRRRPRYDCGLTPNSERKA